MISCMDNSYFLDVLWSHLNSNKYIDIDTIPSDLTVTGKNGQYFA